MSALKFAAVASWPGMAILEKWTLLEDAPIHHKKAEAAAVPQYEYLHKYGPGSVVYGWGSPCSALDFQCDRRQKLLREEKRAAESGKPAADGHH